MSRMTPPALLVLFVAAVLCAPFALHGQAPEPTVKEPHRRVWLGCVLAALVTMALGALGLYLGARTWIGFGESSHATPADISQAHVVRCLPPGATDITLHQELSGHVARYEVSETELLAFLDVLWELDAGQSAHERDEMGGEGEPTKPKRIASRFAAFGWEPLANAVTYHGPSKPSGAMTTYYVDAAAGVVYHDSGYW